MWPPVLISEKLTEIQEGGISTFDLYADSLSASGMLATLWMKGACGLTVLPKKQKLEVLDQDMLVPKPSTDSRYQLTKISCQLYLEQ